MTSKLLRSVAAGLMLIAAGATAVALPPKHYELKVTDFTELKVNNQLNVVYKYVQDSVGYAVFDAPAELVSQIIFTPVQGKLTIDVSNDAQGQQLPTVYVYSTYLSKVENNGTGTVTVESVQPGAQFTAGIQGNGRLVARNLKFGKVEGKIFTGNGTIVLTGECTNANLSNTGAGQIEADGLRAEEAKCSIFGTGSTGVWAVKSLNVHGAATGTVYYKGEPAIKNRTLGVKVRLLQQ